MEKLDLYLEELNQREIQEINGGALSPIEIFRKTAIGFIVAVIVDNWPDIKAGAIDGWNDAAKDGN